LSLLGAISWTNSEYEILLSLLASSLSIRSLISLSVRNALCLSRASLNYPIRKKYRWLPLQCLCIHLRLCPDNWRHYGYWN